MAVDALDPPRRVGGDLDPRLAEDVAELPLGAAAVGAEVELLGQPEVPLAAGREADVGADPGDAEGADRLALEVLPDHVPGAVLRQQRVRVQRPLLLRVLVDRPVREADGALLRDRVLELRQPALHLRRVVGVEHLDALLGARAGLGEAGTAEREVLEREPQRLGVGEAALEQVERRLQRRQLVLLQLQLRQEVALGAERVQLLAGELVALGVERDAERDQLRAVRVEAARERLVAHLRVALDAALDVASRERPPLRHQEGDERQLTDQLVRVVAHA